MDPTNSSWDEGHPALLPWYVAGTLDADAARGIEEHLATCSRCREEVRSWWLVREAAVRDHFAAHVASEDLVAYEADASRLPAERRTLIEEHLARCPDCREDLETARTVSAPAQPAEPPRQLRPLRNPWKLAFAAAAAAAFVTTFLTVGSLRRASPAPPVQQPAHVVLQPDFRGAPGEPLFRGRGPWSVTVILPESAHPGTYTVDLTGGPAREPVVSGLEVHAEPEGVIRILIHRFPGAGHYELRLDPMGSNAESLRYEIEVEP